MNENPENTVTTHIYRYNPYATWIIAIYAICFFWFFFSLSSLGSGEIYIIGAALIAVPLFFRFTNQAKFKIRTWDERELVFSSTGIKFGTENYPVDEMESAAVYLESFNGFEYRERGPTEKIGDVYVKATGDKNAISFRHNDEVTDFTFYLASYAQFCLFRAVMNDWTERGVNVVLKQPFDDDFIVGEMEYYKTPSGFA